MENLYHLPNTRCHSRSGIDTLREMYRYTLAGPDPEYLGQLISNIALRDGGGDERDWMRLRKENVVLWVFGNREKERKPS